MPRLLITVEERFDLQGRGLVLVPALPHEEALAFERAGGRSGTTLRVLFKAPDGTERTGSVRLSLEFFHPVGPRWMCYPDDLKKDDIPIGTEVWLLDR